LKVVEGSSERYIEGIDSQKFDLRLTEKDVEWEDIDEDLNKLSDRLWIDLKQNGHQYRISCDPRTANIHKTFLYTVAKFF